MPELLRLVINAAMQMERQKYLGVEPYERGPERRDQANGYKPKTMKTRVGDITDEWEAGRIYLSMPAPGST